jgi:putative FmdB family regulatory protein
MPIYEFKCLNCNEFVEFLFVRQDDEFELKCPKCDSSDLERVLSSANYSMGNSSAGAGKSSSQTRACGSGSCTTYDIPGPA